MNGLDKLLDAVLVFLEENPELVAEGLNQWVEDNPELVAELMEERNVRARANAMRKP